MNRVGGAQANEVPRIEHADAVIAFFALMHEELAVTAQPEEKVTTQGVCGPDVTRGDVHTGGVRCALSDDLILLDVDEWDRDRADTGVCKLGKGLTDRLGRGEGRIVVD
jgi:hypothetical protein